MSTPLKENLLDSERDTSPRRHRRTLAVSAVIAALLLSASIAGYAAGKRSAAVENVMFRNHTALGAGEMFQFTDKCYSYTGASCQLDTTCDDSTMRCLGTSCQCPHGCVGADGTCHKEDNMKLNNEPFKITNKRWYNYDLYMPMGSSYHLMEVSRWFVTETGAKFNLYKLPGGLYKNHKLYFLTLEAYPTWTVAIHKTVSMFDISAYGLYGVDMAEHGDPRNIAVRVCRMKRLRGVDTIKIGRILENGDTVWARVHSYSDFVWGWNEARENKVVGDGGHWTLSESGILDELEDCEG